MQRIHENISEDVEKVRPCHRDQMDMLRRRLALLSGTDKVLMTMYVENGNSFRQIARVRGVNETSVARRVHRITKRLMGSDYIACIGHRAKLTTDQMAIAKDFFLTGLPMSKIAQKRGSSVHRVRRILMEIRRLISGAEERTKSA
ncbi:MAG: sigma-70 family RNA polymerase sigma factor [Phycisphaerales bacterium]|nr:MAG: sigma-70 family RNA polymerase sigma factor [Phycisphaerales bacterium]